MHLKMNDNNDVKTHVELNRKISVKIDAKINVASHTKITINGIRRMHVGTIFKIVVPCHRIELI